MISFLLVILVCSAHVGVLALLLVLWTIVDVAVHKLVLALSLSASLNTGQPPICRDFASTLNLKANSVTVQRKALHLGAGKLRVWL